MLGPDVRAVLRERRIFEIHHANTVTTSCTFLRVGGLASRGYVDDRGLPQTTQDSDGIDQHYGIWYDVFTDSVDIHERARRRNFYGPVLFVLNTSVLSELPPGSSVLVSKKNPTKWTDNEPEYDRFFPTSDNLRTDFVKGTFDQMIMIRTPNGILPFTGEVTVILDDPQRRLSNGADAFTWASERLFEAAQAGGVNLHIHARECREGCRCVENYATTNVDFFFR